MYVLREADPQEQTGPAVAQRPAPAAAARQPIVLPVGEAEGGFSAQHSVRGRAMGVCATHRWVQMALGMQFAASDAAAKADAKIEDTMNCGICTDILYK